jgi:3'(2'), 5'-bisphosphate nucleotidase
VSDTGVDRVLMTAVASLARRAGQAIMDVYAAEFDVTRKADASPVTEADLAADRIIVAGLAALTPGIPVLTEETLAPPWAVRRQWQRYWLVYPLDGTREFVKRNGEFTVNIALIDRHRSVLGVVLAPVSGDLYAAAEGIGAWREETVGATPRPIRTRAAATPLRVAGSRSHGYARQIAMLERIGEYQSMALGSSLKFCVIARGDADLYLRLGPTSEWDTAAAQCVLEQAGGNLVDIEGHAFRYNTRDSLLNPEFIASGDPSIDWSARMRLSP